MVCPSVTHTKAVTAGTCITKAMNRPLTGGTVEAAAKPWLIISAPPAIPFDTPVPGMGAAAHH